MRHNNIGAKIRQARETAQLSQLSLCEKTQISSARLSQFENGYRFPNRQEWERLSQSLFLGPFPVRCKLPIPQKRWAADSPLPASPERPFAVRLAAAWSVFGEELEQLKALVRARKDFRMCYEFLESAGLDSGDEAFFFLKLLAEGATPCAFSLLRAGYRTYPVIEPSTKQVLGDVRHPCLELIDGRQDCLIFPQISLLVANRVYRLDALVCARCPQRRLWVDVEIDGPGHDFMQDRRREHQLKLPTVRLSRSELYAPNLAASLLTSIHQIRTERRAS